MSSRKYDETTYEYLESLFDEMSCLVTDEDVRVKLENRKQAIYMYCHGENAEVIKRKTGINMQNITRMISRCLEADNDGCLNGIKGIIPNCRTQNNATGKMEGLVRRFPKVFESVLKVYFKSDHGYDRKQQKRAAFRSLLEKLKECGLTDLDYPFNLQDHGRRMFYRFLESVEKGVSAELYMGRFSEDARKLSRATRYEGILLKKSVTRPLSRVEIDGHKIDCECILQIEDYNGLPYRVPIQRIWIIAAIDIATRAIVGVSISINKEYNRLDVLECIESITIPPMLEVGEDPYLPNQIYEEAKAIPSEILLDNAMANLANDVTINGMGHGIIFKMGPAGKPTGRSHIERFFRTLEENTFHRLPSTTGSNPKDPLRVDPQKNAVTNVIDLEDIKKLVYRAIRDYNNLSHSTTGFSPMESFKARIEKEIVPGKPISDVEVGECLYHIVETRTVKCYEQYGRNPQINLFSHRYSSRMLKSDFSMNGEKLIIRINPHNVSTVEAFLSNGTFFDTLHILGDLRGIPITLHQMELLNAHRNAGMNDNDLQERSTDEIINSMKEKSLTSKKNATKYAAVKDLEDLIDENDEEEDMWNGMDERKQLPSAPLDKEEKQKIEEEKDHLYQIVNA